MCAKFSTKPKTSYPPTIDALLERGSTFLSVIEALPHPPLSSRPRTHSSLLLSLFLPFISIPSGLGVRTETGTPAVQQHVTKKN